MRRLALLMLVSLACAHERRLALLMLASLAWSSRHENPEAMKAGGRYNVAACAERVERERQRPRRDAPRPA
jgi:hypothetical protein